MGACKNARSRHNVRILGGTTVSKLEHSFSKIEILNGKDKATYGLVNTARVSVDVGQDESGERLVSFQNSKGRWVGKIRKED